MRRSPQILAFKTIGIFAIGFLSAFAFAESAGSTENYIYVIPGPPTKSPLTADFFSKSTANPAYAVGRDGTPRYFETDSEKMFFSKLQKERWMKRCEPLKSKSLKRFKACFEQEKANAFLASRGGLEMTDPRRQDPQSKTTPYCVEKWLSKNGNCQ